MIVSAHQPHYFPWLGYLHKLFHCEAFVVLDTCDYRKTYYQNRVQIKTNAGEEYITVPVGKHRKPICEMEIAKNLDWMKKQHKTISFAYKSTEFFETYWNLIDAEIFTKDWHNLRDLDFQTLLLVKDILKIDIPIYLASDLRARGEKDDWIVNMCLELGADTYLFGKSGRSYYDPEKFERNHIKVEFQDFQHPVYEQRFMQHGFIPGLSYLDALFNIGPEQLGKLLCN